MILALNTSGLQFGLAIVSNQGEVVAEHYLSTGPRHFGTLFPALEFLLESTQVDLARVRSIAVAMGPGSFTGLRVGMAAAKGLCHSLNLSVVGINTLEALASQAAGLGTLVVAFVYSRKDEVFAALFDISSPGKITRIEDDRAVNFSELGSLGGQEAVFIGNHYPSQAPRLKRAMGGQGVRLAPPLLWTLRASSVGLLGLSKLENGKHDDPNELVPVYHRPPDIRPNPYHLRNY